MSIDARERTGEPADGTPRGRPADGPTGGSAEWHSHYDALVVGAGAGGMAAAARLGHYGYRTLLVERRDRVGGRASTAEVGTEFGEFTVNTGALVFELGGENGRLFDELGVDPGVVVPPTPLVLRLGRRDLPLMSGPGGAVARLLMSGLGVGARRLTRLRPGPGVTVAQWLTTLRARPAVHQLVRNVTSACFAAEPADVPAALFLDYFTKPGGMDVYGAHPEGSVGPWRALARRFERTGGTVWCGSEVTSLTVGPDGLVDGAVVRRAGETVRVGTRLAVSNTGPVATVALCGDAALPAGYGARVRAWSRPGTLITLNFACREPLPGLDGLMFFGSTRRLAYAGNVTLLSPALARPGWYQYAAACTPHPASGDFDADAEVALLRADLRDTFPGFAGARDISVEICAGDWPGQRAIVGHDRSADTPIANLWEVGDGVRAWLGAGQSGCVESARLVTDRIRERYPAAVLRADTVPTGTSPTGTSPTGTVTTGTGPDRAAGTAG